MTMTLTVRSTRIITERVQQQACATWNTCRQARKRYPRTRYRSFSATTEPTLTLENVAAIAECQAVKGEEPLTNLMRSSFDDQTPLVLRNMLSTPKNSRALVDLFPNWDYWEDRVDEATDCHVELGGNYSQSQIADVPFAEFLSYLRFFEERFGRSPATNPGGPDNLPESSDLIYLAQNDLFPEVMEDMDIPEQLLLELGEGKLYSQMIWMGPYGCVSPLHFDPLDNLLMQFVGTKKVFVCASDSPVHAGANGNQKNTSSVNPEKDTAHPEGVAFLQATLHPGDALYIPKKWYHYIRTVETSVSVNTWFR